MRPGFRNPITPSICRADTQYWKFGTRPGPIPAQWYPLLAGPPNNPSIAGAVVSFNITDGLIGDDDIAADGLIVDQGGPGIPPTGPGSENVIPALSLCGLVTLAGLLLGAGILLVRRVS